MENANCRFTIYYDISMAFLFFIMKFCCGAKMQVTGYRSQVTGHKQENDSKLNKIYCDIRGNMYSQTCIKWSLCLQNTVYSGSRHKKVEMASVTVTCEQ